MEHDKNISIIISGEVGSGKSTICECIKRALKREGFNNWTIEGEDDLSVSTMGITYQDRVSSLKRKNPKINIETKQCNRESVK